MLKDEEPASKKLKIDVNFEKIVFVFLIIKINLLSSNFQSIVLSDDEEDIFCHAPSCIDFGKVNKQSSVLYHRFPKDEELLKKWKRFCDKVDDGNLDSCYICTKHFTSNDYTIDSCGKKILKPTGKL